MVEYDTVASVKFEILFPTTYVVDPDDPMEEPKAVQITEIWDYLAEMTAKYGGYTISNPYGPPPFAGGYQGGPLEQKVLGDAHHSWPPDAEGSRGCQTNDQLL